MAPDHSASDGGADPRPGDTLQRNQQAFTAQSAGFSSAGDTYADAEDLAWMLAELPLSGADRALDVATGTGELARALVPRVATVVGVDATEAMLEQGRRFVAQHGIANIRFEHGIVEALPFESVSFDVVTSRYAFHHFADPKPVLAEMARVCKPGGHLLIIDIVIPDETMRGTYDYYEWLCDPSHIRCLGFEELRALVGLFGFDVTSARARAIDEPVLEWMDFSLTSDANRAEILAALRDELAGGARTGMSPFERDGVLYFEQRDAAVVGRKKG